MCFFAAFPVRGSWVESEGRYRGSLPVWGSPGTGGRVVHVVDYKGETHGNLAEGRGSFASLRFLVVGRNRMLYNVCSTNCLGDL